MKRITTTLSIVLLSMVAVAQPSDSLPQLNDFATTTSVASDKVTQLERELAELKLTTQQLKKEVETLKKRVPPKAKRPEISRTSSKGAVWVDQ